MFSNISVFPDIHQRAIQNTLTKADHHYILPDTCQEILLQEEIKCKRSKKAAKEKKNVGKEERKLAQGESSSAKETG